MSDLAWRTLCLLALLVAAVGCDDPEPQGDANTDGDADADADSDTDADGDADGDTDADGDGDADDDADETLDGDIDGDGASDGDLDGDMEGEPDADGEQGMTIYKIQDTNHPENPEMGADVAVDGVIVTTPRSEYGFWVEEPGGGRFSGIFVYISGGFDPPALQMGDVIDVSGTYTEYHDRSQITARAITVVGHGQAPDPEEVTTAQVCTECPDAEAYEGVLLRLTDLDVTEELSYGEVLLQPTGGGESLSMDDLFSAQYDYTPSVGDRFSELTGVLEYSYSAFKLEPRGCADLIDEAGEPHCAVPCDEGLVAMEQLRNRDAEDAVAPRCQVRLEGVVVSTPIYEGDETSVFWVQEPQGGPFSGIMVSAPSGAASALDAGSVLSIDGIYHWYYHSAWLEVLELEESSSGEPPEPQLLSPSEINEQGLLSYQYEGVLVEVEDVVTVETPVLWEYGSDFWFFDVASPSAPEAQLMVAGWGADGFVCPWEGPGAPCETDGRQLGQRFSFVAGILRWDNYIFLRPRGMDDLELAPCAPPDSDCDGIEDTEDLCPAHFDPEQADSDEDGQGDRCDLCPRVDTLELTDSDGDGIGDLCDLCPQQADAAQRDTDDDGEGDLCDPDVDGDGIDEGDGTSPCTGGESEDCQDNCPWVANSDQADGDGNGRGDACEGQMASIVLDGLFDDWASVPLAHRDPAGDGGAFAFDFERLWIADDEQRLFLRLEQSREVVMQYPNPLVLYLDTDNNPATGLDVAGMGADLVFRPADNSGSFYADGAVHAVDSADIGFELLPTVGTDELEVSFSLDALPDGANPLFPGAVARLAVADEQDGDQIPDGLAGGVAYTLGRGEAPTRSPVDLSRALETDLRIVSLNTGEDGLFTGRADAMGRMLDATSPDIILLQEVWDHEAADVEPLIEGWLGGRWHSTQQEWNVVVSQYPIVETYAPFGRTQMVLLDTAAVLGEQLLVINIHMPCCENVPDRVYWIDTLLSALREVQEGSVMTVAEGTPIVIAGDANLVALRRSRDAIATGDIQFESFFGPDFGPDWDGTALEILSLEQTGDRSGATHPGNDFFWSGLLDYVFFSDSVLDIGSHFILNTGAMTNEELTDAGLEAADSEASDHLLLCADIRPGG